MMCRLVPDEPGIMLGPGGIKMDKGWGDSSVRDVLAAQSGQSKFNSSVRIKVRHSLLSQCQEDSTAGIPGAHWPTT